MHSWVICSLRSVLASSDNKNQLRESEHLKGQKGALRQIRFLAHKGFFRFPASRHFPYSIQIGSRKRQHPLNMVKVYLLKLYYPHDPPWPGQVIQNLDLYSTRFLIFTQHNGQTPEIRCLVSQYLPQMSNLTTLRGGGITSGADGDIKWETLRPPAR